MDRRNIKPNLRQTATDIYIRQISLGNTYSTAVMSKFILLPKATVMFLSNCCRWQQWDSTILCRENVMVPTSITSWGKTYFRCTNLAIRRTRILVWCLRAFRCFCNFPLRQSCIWTLLVAAGNPLSGINVCLGFAKTKPVGLFFYKSENSLHEN